MRIAFLAVPIILFTSSCVTSGANTASAPPPIRLINQKIADECKYVGQSAGVVYNPLTFAANNITAARNKAALELKKTGANAGLVVSTDSDQFGHNATVVMDGYTCSQ